MTVAPHGIDRTGARRSAHRRERAQETLQAIYVAAFILVPLLCAIIAFGSVVHAYISVQGAAAAGARSAGADGAFGEAQLQLITTELDADGIDPSTCEITPSDAAVGLGQPISVTVVCPAHVAIPFVPEPSVALTSTYTALGEVNR